MEVAQMEIIKMCSMISEGVAAINGITDMHFRAFLFACACVYAMKALARMLWGIK
jgi:hypothetical protein